MYSPFFKSYCYFITAISMIITAPVFSQDCREPIEYLKAMHAADSCVAVGNYSMAQKFYNAAKVYCKDKSSIVEAKKDSLFVLIDGLRAEADNAKKRADSTKIIAEKNADDARNALAEIARKGIHDADRAIKNLDYEQGLSILNDAVKLNAAHKDVSAALLEFVYFFAETGRYDRAQGVLDTVAIVLVQGSSVGSSPPIPPNLSTFKNLTNLSQFHNAINTLSPGRLAQLEEKYYPVMVDIPGGTNTMGNTLRDDGGSKHETPHIVTLSPFSIAKTETTWWQFNLYCEATGRIKPSTNNWSEIGDNPVYNVSWHDATDYANWISKQLGMNTLYTGEGDEKVCNWVKKGYRLPTEAEWECAARAGSNARFGNGKNIIDPNEVNFDSEEQFKLEYSIVGHYREKTIPVGSLNCPNAFGLHDMSGNIDEWCWDRYEGYPTEPTSNPHGADSGSYRVLRGGSWYNDPLNCRVARRFNYGPEVSLNFIGFRLARTN